MSARGPNESFDIVITFPFSLQVGLIMLIEAIMVTGRISLMIDDRKHLGRTISFRVRSHHSTLRHGFRSKAGFPRCLRDRQRTIAGNLLASFFPDTPISASVVEPTAHTRTKVTLAASKATGKFVSVEDGNDRRAVGG